MKPAAKTLKIADPEQQILPGEAAETATRKAFSEPDQLPPIGSASSGSIGSSHIVGAAGGQGTTPQTTTLSTETAKGGTLPVDQLHDAIALHALRLKESGTDLLKIFIDAGSGTRLSLELSSTPAGILAHASLQAGDFDHLSQRWGELQHRLQAHGVQLAALTCDDQSTGNQRQPRHSDAEPSADRESRWTDTDYAFGGAMTETPSRGRHRAKANHGWETWA